MSSARDSKTWERWALVDVPRPRDSSRAFACLLDLDLDPRTRILFRRFTHAQRCVLTVDAAQRQESMPRRLVAMAAGALTLVAVIVLVIWGI